MYDWSFRDGINRGSPNVCQLTEDIRMYGLSLRDYGMLLNKSIQMYDWGLRDAIGQGCPNV